MTGKFDNMKYYKLGKEYLGVLKYLSLNFSNPKIDNY